MVQLVDRVIFDMQSLYTLINLPLSIIVIIHSVMGPLWIAGSLCWGQTNGLMIFQRSLFERMPSISAWFYTWIVTPFIVTEPEDWFYNSHHSNTLSFPAKNKLGYGIYTQVL